MIEPIITDPSHTLEPVHTGEEKPETRWTERLVLFLRVMAGLSMLKGLYHWAQVCGIAVSADQIFETHTTPWQAATIFFAVIDLVAAVGLWLAAPWGAVVWLTSIVSMITVEILFPQIYGGGSFLSFIDITLLAAYLWLALKSAREQPA